MERTKELDKHWRKYYWCETCKCYTGYVTEEHKRDHAEHELVKLGRRKNNGRLNKTTSI